MAGFDRLAYIFESLGVMDFLLPFIIVFTIMYAVLLTMPLFKDNKKFSIVLAMAFGLLFVVPHITGDYPLGVDPVEIMNNSLPQIALVAIASVMMLILLGVFGSDLSENAAPFVLLIAVGFTVFIFRVRPRIMERSVQLPIMVGLEPNRTLDNHPLLRWDCMVHYR